MRVEIDLARCVGYGNCVDVAPAVFRMSDVSDVAEALVPEPGPELAGTVQKAVRVCPAHAITMTGTPTEIS